MRKSELSPRLNAIARLLEPGKRVVDVGTDHGFLPVWLALRGTADRITATDIRRAPLARAVRAADAQGVGGRIRFVLCDGLDFDGAQESDTVVIAGMGGETIISILNRAPWTKTGVRLILQPQSRLDELCGWLSETGYRLDDAVLAEDAGRLYAVLSVSGAGKCPCAPIYAEDALLEARDPLLPRWLRWRIGVLGDAIAGMSAGKGQNETGRMRKTLARLIRTEEACEKWQPSEK
jgi:tRNA (adenine22-N1)-methyltransferase